MNDARTLYDPALVQREADGQFWHPDLPFPEGSEDDDNDVDLAQALQDQGYEYTRVQPDEYPEDADGYWEWMKTWQPEQPAGDGWLLCCIADTEDGPGAWFVRPLSEGSDNVAQGVAA